MKLKVLLPTEILIEETVGKINAEAPNGFFCLLPRHVDFVTALVPGLLSYEPETEQKEYFLAVSEGILVKSGANILVSVRRAVKGGKLGELRRIVEEKFRVLDDREQTARSAMSRIEAGFVRRFLEVQKRG
ncbi:MAG TPA: F0F1 ATP synthase subunit epsilon [Desulfobacteraceae bacterium]|nr:F0F1 ATP synthase subunit epsilon [Desulfobacteraceae bacterium]